MWNFLIKKFLDFCKKNNYRIDLIFKHVVDIDLRSLLNEKSDRSERWLARDDSPKFEQKNALILYLKFSQICITTVYTIINCGFTKLPKRSVQIKSKSFFTLKKKYLKKTYSR